MDYGKGVGYNRLKVILEDISEQLQRETVRHRDYMGGASGPVYDLDSRFTDEEEDEEETIPDMVFPPMRGPEGFTMILRKKKRGGRF
ncbi:hypothetical protein ACFL0V_00150 [Nanoarchaeota archaeon]